jgi:general secretion pathway protein L
LADNRDREQFLNLILDIDEQGINAFIVCHASDKSNINETIHIKYKNLPEGEEPFTAALDFITGQIDISSCAEAIILIPTSSVCFRNIEMPFRSARKIKQVLPIELEQMLPVAEERYITDFCKFNHPNMKSQVTLFTASVIESYIDKIIAALKTHGVHTQIISPKGYAVTMAVLWEKPSVNSFICLDLGPYEITIGLIYNRQIFSVRSFSTQQCRFEQLEDQLKLTFLGFKQSTGIDSYFDIFIVKNTDSQEVLKLYSSIENMMNYQKKFHFSDAEPQQPELKELNLIQLVSSLFDPNKIKNMLINFYKIKMDSESAFRKNSKSILTCCFLLLALFIVSIYSLYVEINDLNDKIAMIKKASLSILKETFPEEKNIGYPLLQMQSLVKEAVEGSDPDRNGHPRFDFPELTVVYLLATLSETIPDTIDREISRFYFESKQIALSGTTDNFKNVDTIKGLIEKINFFKQTTIDNAAIDEATGLINFNFTIQI